MYRRFLGRPRLKGVAQSSTLSTLADKMPPRRPADPVLDDGRDTDIVIPVMGPTKAGKSSFLNSLAGPRTFVVGERLASCTSIIGSHIVPRAPQEYKGYKRLNDLLNGRRIVLVDTPGFDDTHMGDEEILSRISDWLTASYRKGMLVGGVLYLHDISRDGFPGSSLRNLKLFAKLCGGEAMEQVAFVTTKWDRLKTLGEGTERVQELESDFWKKMLDKRASVRHVQPPDIAGRLTDKHKRPWEIINEMIVSATARDVNRRILQIQDEIVRQKRFLPETDAGRELRMSLENLLRTAKDLKRQAKEEGGAQSAEALQKRQEEINRITAQLRAMKLPGLAVRAMRFFRLL